MRLREWSHGHMAHPNKFKMAVAAIFNFRKISITPDWIKVIRMTLSNESLKHMCVDLSELECSLSSDTARMTHFCQQWRLKPSASMLFLLSGR